MPASPVVLRRASVFAALSETDVEALAVCFRERRCAPGEVVFREGDAGASAFLVAEGELSVATRAAGSRPIAKLAPGQLVGEVALAWPVPRTTTVVASRRAVVLEVDAAALPALRRTAPAAWRALLGAAMRGAIRHLHTLEQRVERDLERALP